ncbi:MAG: hypothetical protein NUV67_06245 [archaeon]|nr:hypothetical protein [archaeon]
MVTDEEIIRLWNGLSDAEKKEAAIRMYRMGENAGISAFEKELLADETIETALKVFGWGRGKKSATITTRAIMREAARIAKEKAQKQN